MPMMEMFDRGIQLRMGQAHVKRWIDDILPLVLDRRRPARDPRPGDAPPAAGRRPHGYEMFQAKKDGCIKVVLTP